jgi:polar amino acid transport system ATP-binding protein
MPDEGKIMTDNKKPILRIENICKTLGGKEILKAVSLDLYKGELKVLIGPSGAGKSTLLQCINFLILPDSGRVWLDGNEIQNRHKRDLYAFRQQVGMIFQDFNLFDHLNALDNVSIALRKVKKMRRQEARDRAVAELERVGLGDKIDLYPAELSGGQKQRVSIARALAMDPKIMLLDEPTSALDPELIGEVLSVIRDLARGGMTMIVATHQIGFTRSLADEVLFMENGIIIEQGSPQDLLAPDARTRSRDFCSRLNELYEENV